MSPVHRLRRALFGAPRDVKDPHAFHKLSLVALLAWVGLGADGLSSSAYGPDEAFRQLGQHQGLAVFLALAMALTVFIISYGYSRIIEQFPSGGGGYVVASKLLGPRVGVLSGAALLVDYVLTITISIASGADQIFSFLPEGWLGLKLGFAFLGLAGLTVMNLRGVKESVTAIAPVFVLFLITHAIVLFIAIGGHVTHAGAVAHQVQASVSHSRATLGLAGTLALFVRAYSLGGGTYTGIEAVSNGMAIMREPRVRTAQRTMVLMATSLALTAGGILLAYLLVGVTPVENKTMNFVLFDRVAGGWQALNLPIGRVFVVLSLLSEGALLFVAAQAGFLDGPRVMANMATDSWLPHRFSALSERLTMRNGVMLMAGAGALSLIYTHGDVSKLVVMYSINVFLTFTLSNVAMTLFWWRARKADKLWYKHLPAHVMAASLCATILAITVYEKLAEGGWLTVLITVLLTLLCFAIRRHYRLVVRALEKLDTELPGHEESPETYGVSLPLDLGAEPAALDAEKPVAIVFVGRYSGLGRHALLTLMRMFPGHFASVVFVSIAVVDSDSFKGVGELKQLEERTQQHLDRYRGFAQALGLPAQSRYAVGTEVAVEAEKLGQTLLAQYPKALVVAGQIIFDEDTAWNRLLHNETAFIIQRRLQHVGVPMVVLPVQLNLSAVGTERTVRRQIAELAA
jgi:amino acid transporter